MLDETSVVEILIQHFPDARAHDLADAARDVVLLDLLADDRLLVWEDSMSDPKMASRLQVYASAAKRGS